MASPVRIDPRLARWLARESRRLTRACKRPVSRVEVSRILGVAIGAFSVQEVADGMADTFGDGPPEEPLEDASLNGPEFITEAMRHD